MNNKTTDPKVCFATNLKRYIEIYKVSRRKLSDDINIKYSTMKNISIKHKKLTKDNQQPSIYSEDYHLNEGSTTISNESTSQANGDGNALPNSK